MGASQSTAGAGQTDAGAIKTSYYELLGAERTATQDELKKAYRKKALELHPDRNYGDVERTTALFADVQHAYQVLSDDQERAWYDAHEADILRGGTGEGQAEDQYQGNMKVTTPDDLTRIMARFRSSVQFTDAPSGFFGFVRDTFEQLAKEEEYAADYDGVAIPSYPSFGHKDDDYDGVVRDFYAAWDGFATAKSFAWLDVYRLSDAPDRYTRRLAEKENKKHRDDGRREFNDAVRTLVAFVRKRDPRYTPDTRSAEDKAQAQREQRKAQAARARAELNARLEREAQELPAWATDRPASELDESDDDIEEDHYECVACNKTFKSERQYEAHEKSKKHQKALKDLKRRMQRDNAHLDLDVDADGLEGSGVVTPGEDFADAVETHTYTLMDDDAIETQTYTLMDDDAIGTQTQTLDGDAVETQTHMDDIDDMATKTHHLDLDDMTTKTHHLDLDDAASNAENEAVPESSPDDESHNAPSPKPSTDDDDEYTSRSAIKARLAPSPSPTSTSTSAPPKLGAAAKKRAKKAAKAAHSDPAPGDHACIGCDASFASKTRLHEHLKGNPGHAVLKSGLAEGGKGKARGKRK